MPYFRYKAVNAAGEIVEGELQALDRVAAIDRLHREGSTPIRADELGRTTIWEFRLRRMSDRQRLSLGDISLLSQELATLLKAGLSVDRALTILASLADKPGKRAFAADVLQKVRSGATLGDALEQRRQALPSYYVGMVRAGEASNSLATIFARLAELLNQTRAVRENIKTALYYPVIVLVVAAFTIAILLTVVVPEFRPLFDSAGATLPWPTRFVIASGDIVTQSWWAFAVAVAAIVVGWRYHYGRAAGRLFWDARILKMPVVGALALKLEIARFARTLGTLLSSGVVELNALSLAVSTLTNRAVANAVATVAARLKRGDGWSSPLRDTGVFPELAVQMIEVGEESGQLPTMLIQVAAVFDESVERTLQRLLSLLVPIVTILLGLVVAAIIGAMLMAILNIYSVPI